MTVHSVIPIAHAAAARNPRNAGTCDIFHIAGRIGQAHRSPAWICRTINGYIAHAAFPAPFPKMVAGELALDVRRDSTWPLVAVDAWFDDRLPPEARAALDQAERAAVDSRLSARAATLFQGRGA